MSTSTRPVIGLRPHKRSSGRGKQLFVVALMVGGVYLWITEIGGDLGGPKLSTEKPKVAAVVRPAGPHKARLPSLDALAGRQAALPTLPGAGADPVARALLATARDHVARRVVPTVGSVLDLNAVKGSSGDLLERSLHAVGFPLRTAVVLHRFRDPKAYGLRGRPQATEAERRRAVGSRNLHVFLERFARQLPTQWSVSAPDTYLPGDLVVVARKKKGGRRNLIAVVAEKTNDHGVSLLYTLDPRDRVARADRPLSDYRVIDHYRLHQGELDHVRDVLPLPPPPRAVGTPL